MKNSWGEEFAKKGVFKVSYDAFDNLEVPSLCFCM